VFYTFSQNNSFGEWKDPAKYVIVESDTSEEAQEIAVENGVYFDGCRNGQDCSCCGDRWYRWPWVDEVPSIYGEPVETANPDPWMVKDSVPLYLVVKKALAPEQ
jgi:hypothetical protein